jgi:hypothetical protein
MSDDTDYSAVKIPTDIPREKYNAKQRRAEILNIIHRLGHPGAVNQSELARAYGCTPQNVNNDMDVLAGYIEDQLDDRRTLVVQSVFQKSIRGLIEDEDWKDAAIVAEKWDSWLTDRSELGERLDALEEKLSKEDANPHRIK